MTYSANMAFARYSPATAEQFRALRPPCRLRLFEGWMGSCPTDMGVPGIIGAELNEDLDPDSRDSFEKLLPAVVRASAAAPSLPMLVAHVFCWGGSCEQFDLLVVKSGRVVFERHLDANRALSDEYWSSLTEAAEHLGLALDEGYFPPFTGDAFERLGRDCD